MNKRRRKYPTRKPTPSAQSTEKKNESTHFGIVVDVSWLLITRVKIRDDGCVSLLFFIYAAFPKSRTANHQAGNQTKLCISILSPSLFFISIFLFFFSLRHSFIVLDARAVNKMWSGRNSLTIVYYTFFLLCQHFSRIFCHQCTHTFNWINNFSGGWKLSEKRF